MIDIKTLVKEQIQEEKRLILLVSSTDLNDQSKEEI